MSGILRCGFRVFAELECFILVYTVIVLSVIVWNIIVCWSFNSSIELVYVICYYIHADFQ